MDKFFLLRRLDDICGSLSRVDGALALLALGSIGKDTQRIDQYSDLDFFIICKKGYKNRFLENLDYLEDAAHIGYKFRNTSDGYKLLYTDGCFCEFAIFEPHELENIPFSEGRIVWKSNDFDESVCVPKKLPVQKDINIEWTIGEALTNIYIGLGRYYRGEKLSAFTFIEGYAKDRILELITQIYPSESISKDVFAIERRFEFAYPQSVSVLPQMIQGYDKVVESAKFMMDFLCENFKINEAMKKAISDLFE